MVGSFSFVWWRSSAPLPFPAQEGPRPPTGGCGQHYCWPLAMRVLLDVYSVVQLCSTACGSGRRNRSALALLVPGVRADHHDAAVAADDPALTADLLDARLDLHGKLLLLVSVNDATAAEVIRAELYNHPIVGQDPDVVHPHLPADVGKYLVPVVQLHAEESIRQRLHHRAFDLDGAVFLGHILRASSCIVLIGVLAVRSSSDRYKPSWTTVLPRGIRPCGKRADGPQQSLLHPSCEREPAA